MTLAERVKQLRVQRGISQRELARRSQIAPGTLSYLESGKFQGDFKTHQKLAMGLGINLIELYRGLEGIDDVGSSSSPLILSSEFTETFHYSEKAQAILLAQQIFQKPFLPQLLILQVGGQTHQEETRIGIEKWIFVIKGLIDIQIGEKHHRLEPYSSIFFKASEPHQVMNVGESVAECILVTSPVGV